MYQTEITSLLHAKIEKWKRDLIDLTNRNVLLNFRAKKTNSIQILDNAKELFDQLVNESKSVKVEQLITHCSQQMQKIEASEEDKETKKKKIEDEKQHFNKLLSKLRTTARTRMNEQGIHTLYLVFGVLKWRELGNDREFFAPLLLVPVELTRQSANHPFTLRTVDEDIVLNPFLAHKLKEEKGILLPELEEKEDLNISQIWKDIEEQVCNVEGWAVIPDIYISLFSFSKLVMYKDFENYRDLFESHPLIQAISGESKEQASNLVDLSDIPNEGSLDRAVPSQDTYQVLDSDSSQLQAIMAAKKGVSFVLQGPPGTGKSQTISNIIAEFLANDKKVLFVSEKMAALEVVKSRLEKVGLGDFCLELHSHKSNKRAVLDALNDVMSKDPDRRKIDEQLYERINNHRDDLNSYAIALHQVRPPLGKSVYEVHGILAKLDSTPELMFEYEISSDTNETAIMDLLTELERYRNRTIFVDGEPVWKGFKGSTYSLEIASNVEQLLRNLVSCISVIKQNSSTIFEQFGLKGDSLQGYARNLQIIESASYSPNPPAHWFSQESIKKVIDDAKAYQERMIRFLEQKQQLTASFKGDILDLPLTPVFNMFFNDSQDLYSTLGQHDSIVLLNNRRDILSSLTNGIISLKNFNALDELSLTFGLSSIDSISDVKKLSIYLSVLKRNPQPNSKWFSDLTKVKATLAEAKQKYEHLIERRSELLSKYNHEVLTLDLFSLKQHVEAKSNTVLKLFKPSDSTETSDTYIFSKRQSILERLSKLITLREYFNTTKARVESVFGNEISNIKLLRNLRPVVQKVITDPRPQTSWFQVDRHYEIRSLIQDAKKVQTKYLQEIKSIADIYEEEVIDERIVDMFERFENKYQSFFRDFKGSYRRDRKWLYSKLKEKNKYDFETMFKHVRSLNRVLEQKQWMSEKQNQLQSTFGWHFKGHDTNWEAIENSFETVREIIELSSGQTVHMNLRDLLINPAGQLEQLSSDFERLISLGTQIEEVCSSLRAEFPALFELWNALPIESWPLTDTVDFIADNMRNLNALYESVDTLMSQRKPATLSHISVSGVVSDLELALNLLQQENDTQQQESIYQDYLGIRFDRESTRWDALEQAIVDFEKLIPVSQKLPVAFQDILLDGTNFELPTLIDVDSNLQTLENSIACLTEQFSLLFEKMNGIPFDKWQLQPVYDRLMWLNDRLNNWYNPYDALKQNVVRTYNSLSELKGDLETALLVQEIKRKLDDELDDLQHEFGDFFSGYSTNWDLIFDALAWLEEWLGFFDNSEVPNALLNFVAQGSSAESKPQLKSVASDIRQLEKRFNSLQSQMDGFFDIQDISIDNKSLVDCEFASVQQWIQYRLESMELLEEWIRFNRLEKRLIEVNLGSFMQILLMENHGTDHSFIDLFQKRFYRKWLDAVYEKDEILYDFEAAKLNDKIVDFRKSDLNSLKVNAQRIQAKLENNRKHALHSLNYRREHSVLLHEIGKKKRHIPIRKLLSQAVGLVLELKPCVLMSPLSVSQFVDAHKIHFDVVIFDEASQIFPEDAIGSIIRASQVIVVGDNKQLPPMDFFNKADRNSEEFDDEEDVEYESILDECMHVVPSMRLQWHYRSKHESLISFSNAAFYQNSLITFPSAENGEELGVKFVHVPDGIYDRGGTSTNKREADVIAALVFDHFKKYPNRSLGVIAFSDAQASAISDSIDHIRQHRPDTEKFFQEGISEEFFVKSLESVQGDERDVIFFSVGYGKDATGKIYANFGPLTRNGGERRLNVAVTRAKYHVKLISSLLPQEMPTEKTQSVGVHRLRDYMQMAINGSLPVYASADNQVVFDSPFEEDVYNALVDMGYQVVTQVGCSGYRIDLAVLDPLNPDRYLLAIECDGKTYHSSKVARDRDRLRQQVLEGLGWKIHRIWSQEWFKKRKFELSRLKNLLNSMRLD